LAFFVTTTTIIIIMMAATRTAAITIKAIAQGANGEAEFDAIESADPVLFDVEFEEESVVEKEVEAGLVEVVEADDVGELVEEEGLLEVVEADDVGELVEAGLLEVVEADEAVVDAVDEALVTGAGAGAGIVILDKVTVVRYAGNPTP
jgi:hypothetical protein